MESKHIQAEKDYVKGMKYKDLAEKYGVSINTIKSWKKRHGWERKKGAPKRKSVHTKKGGQPGNVNALGNSGGAAPIRNQNAKTHGFYAKHMPAEAFEIMQDIQEFSPADLLWEQIQIQFTAIVRAQKIMFVESKDEMIKELKKKKSVVSDSADIEEEEYEFQFAWDRHATFLNAQSRAMSELRGLIKQFDNIAHETDERRLKLEQMRLNIEKTKKAIDGGSEGSGENKIASMLQKMVNEHGIE
ncbi:phage terminase small subunit [Bacillus safensis]|uniref:phage terminase small subunit n=1 Tax=Bacillus safensis TaxID=561879 RepID=UPI002282A21E|nr:phage terminase small subunit [Bacillus safensis]MCY7563822.1 phage terminase small subunit [Bacillus safensis]MCY7625468.1 phage terminase small subunit [Bacillus safensis]MCY7632438.1 phage terminase small subunit [Bacillus safensis]MCY7646850.1 phage terminase small subunit [Bacillus safensis]MCY7652580.1 phage terminase small subunit [Bacillus safensis]